MSGARRRELGLAVALATVFAAGLLIRTGLESLIAALAGAAVVALALAVRRRAPLTALAAVTAIKALVVWHDASSIATAAPVVVALYTVSTLTPIRSLVAAAGASIGILAVVEVASAAQRHAPANLLPVVLLFLLGVVTGLSVRNHRAFLAAALARAEAAERSLEEEARRRVAESRVAIARDLHDSVAHQMAVINVQAGVARHLLAADPARAAEALGHVQDAAQAAIADMGSVISTLRDGTSPDLSPAPTSEAAGPGRLSEALGLPALVQTYTDGGMTVAIEVTDTNRCDGPLPDDVRIAAYRIVQEALTNAAKHAPGAAVQVQVTRRADVLELAITNRASLHPPAPTTPWGPLASVGATPVGGTSVGATAVGRAAGTGHGLLGAAERAERVGGRCTAGPLPGGGFRVSATLPMGRPA